MRKLLILLGLLLLVACGSESSKSIDVEEFESKVIEAVKQMDTDFEIVSNTENEDGTYTIMVSDNAGFIIDGNKVSASYLTPYNNDEVIQLFTILIGCVDDTLSFGDRNLVINDLGIRGDIDITDYTKVVTHNDIQYTVHGDSDAIILQAEIK